MLVFGAKGWRREEGAPPSSFLHRNESNLLPLQVRRLLRSEGLSSSNCCKQLYYCSLLFHRQHFMQLLLQVRQLLRPAGLTGNGQQLHSFVLVA